MHEQGYIREIAPMMTETGLNRDIGWEAVLPHSAVKWLTSFLHKGQTLIFYEAGVGVALPVRTKELAQEVLDKWTQYKETLENN